MLSRLVYLDIDGGYFFASAAVRVLWNGDTYCTQTSGNVKYLIGWSADRILRYVIEQKGWGCQIEENQIFEEAKRTA